MFKDRIEAGIALAKALSQYRDDPNAIVLALPRGGVVLGDQISQALHIPLDIILVRKLGVPFQEELAFGAISLEGVQILNESVLNMIRLDPATISKVVAKEQQELDRRNALYRENRPFPDIQDKVVILVDDGIATGATMRAAIRIVQLHHPKKVIVAVPLASSSVYYDMADEDIQLLVLETPEPFYGIGMWYGEFLQVSDQEVIDLLQRQGAAR